MKKIFLACAVVCAAMTITSCGSSKESAYRKAYEKAKAQEAAQQNSQNVQQEAYVQPPVQQVQQPVQQVEQQVQQPVVTQLETAPAQSQTVVSNNVPVRSENLKVVSGSGLKAYSVVVGSFGVRANAEGLQSTLNKAGYQAQVAYNEQAKMYRVVAATFDSMQSAVNSRDSFRSTYPGAWLLYQK